MSKEQAENKFKEYFSKIEKTLSKISGDLYVAISMLESIDVGLAVFNHTNPAKPEINPIQEISKGYSNFMINGIFLLNGIEYEYYVEPYDRDKIEIAYFRVSSIKPPYSLSMDGKIGYGFDNLILDVCNNVFSSSEQDHILTFLYELYW